MTVFSHLRVCGCVIQVFLPCLDLYHASILKHLCLVVEGDRHCGFGMLCTVLILYWSYNNLIMVYNSHTMRWYAIGINVLTGMVFENVLSTPILFCHSLVWYCDDLLCQHLQTALLPNLLLTPVCPLMEVVCYLVLGLFLHFENLQDSDLALTEIQAYQNPVEVWTHHQNW